jgi:hypothetical protein
LKAFPNGYFDWLYIDGDHSLEAVRGDLRLAMEKVKRGGLVCGDDYRLGLWWKDGVVKPVHELLASGGVLAVYIREGQFAVRKLV